MGELSPISNPATPTNHSPSRFAPDRFEFTSSMLESALVRGQPTSRASAGRNAESGYAGSRPSDQLDLSERARLIGRMKQLPPTPPVRSDLVSQIRQQIQEGHYETSDKLNEAISNLSSELDLWA